jgi:hypothetical protein
MTTTNEVAAVKDDGGAKKTLIRVCEAIGITTPMQLICVCENDSESFGDLLVKIVRQRIEKADGMQSALREADEYLSNNPLNQIGSGSILHQTIRAAIAKASPSGALK